MDCAARPRPAEIGQRCPCVQKLQRSRSRAFRLRRTPGRSIGRFRSLPPGPAPGRRGRSGCSCARRAPARPLTAPVWSIELRRRPKPGGPPWRKAELDQPALTREHLGGQLAAVFAGHRALDALDDGRDRAAVILELLGAVLNADAGALADVFVVGALIGVLKPAPAADVVDQDGREIGVPFWTSSISCLRASRPSRSAGRSCPASA